MVEIFSSAATFVELPGSLLEPSLDLPLHVVGEGDQGVPTRDLSSVQSLARGNEKRKHIASISRSDLCIGGALYVDCWT